MKKYMFGIRSSLCALMLVPLLGGCAAEDTQPTQPPASESEAATAAEAADASEKAVPGGNVKDGTRIDLTECTLRRQDSPEILPMTQLTPENEPTLLGGFIADSTDGRRMFQFTIGKMPDDRDGTFTLWSAPEGKDRVYMRFSFKDVSIKAVGTQFGSDDPAKNDEINKIDKGQNEIFPGGYTTVVHLVPELGKYFTDKTVMEISNKTVVTQCKAPKSST